LKRLAWEENSNILGKASEKLNYIKKQKQTEARVRNVWPSDKHFSVLT
jgi:hypothetical protein